jgi:flagellar export protein FliJ
MSRTLDALLRIREHGKRNARLQLLEAEAARADQEAAIEQTLHRVAIARRTADEDPAAMARYHAFRLRMEMVQRRQEQELMSRERQVSRAREDLRDAARESRVVELVIENRDRAEAEEARRSETALMNELGVQAWWRQSA